MSKNKFEESVYCNHEDNIKVGLDCNHYVCMQCCKISGETIKCKLCEQINENCLKKRNKILRSSSYTNETTTTTNLFEIISQQYDLKLADLNDCIKEAKEKLKNQFKYVKEEIEIRIESIKTQLETLVKVLENELDEKQTELTNKLSIFDKYVEQYNLEFKHLEQDLQNNVSKYAENVQRHEENLKQLNQICDNLKSLNNKVVFQPSTEEAGYNLIGKIAFSDPLLVQVRNGLFDKTKLEHEATIKSFTVLNDNLLAVVDVDSVKIYDDSFRQLKVLQMTIKNADRTFMPRSICSNFNDRIYISDRVNSQLVALDFDLNLVCFIDKNSSNLMQVVTPEGMCYSNNSLYVCDYMNNKLKVYNEDLVFRKFYVAYGPRSVQISGQVVCIDYDDQTIFYEFESFNILHKYGKGAHRVEFCAVNSYFYGFVLETKTLICYNNDGSINSETRLTLPEDLSFSQIAYSKNKFILSASDNLRFLFIRL